MEATVATPSFAIEYLWNIGLADLRNFLFLFVTPLHGVALGITQYGMNWIYVILSCPLFLLSEPFVF